MDDAGKYDSDPSDAKKHLLTCMLQLRDGSECQVSAAYDDEKGVFLNRPFVYMIVETENMTPVFAGVINTMFGAY